MFKDEKVSYHTMWIDLSWFKSMIVNNQTKVSVMESTVIELSEEQKPFPRFISLATILAFPILFEFRNE